MSENKERNHLVEITYCDECENYVPLDITDQFGRIIKKTGRGYCKHIKQRGDRRDDDWCKWRSKKNGES